MRRLAVLGMALLLGGSAIAAAFTWGNGGFAGDPAAIKEGMTADQVRAIAGFPDATTSVRLGMGEYERKITLRITHGGPPVLTGCWLYHVLQKPDSGLLAVTACFRRDRVLRVIDTVHG